MSEGKPRQFNFNSFVGLGCAGLIGLGITKMDALNTSSIRQEAKVDQISEHVSAIDSTIKSFVTRAEFNAGMNQRSQEILELKKQIEALRARLPGAPRP